MLEELATRSHSDPASATVQSLIERHYTLIRQFWGTSDCADNQAEAYAGLGRLFVEDEFFMSKDGVPRPQFAAFMRDAMRHYATRLSSK